MPSTLDQIHAMRDKFVAAGFRPEAVDVTDSVTVTYFVVPHKWIIERAPGVPLHFAMRMTPALSVLQAQQAETGRHRRLLSDITVFGVSAEIDHLLRPFVARHEAREFLALALERPTQVMGATDTVPNGCRLCSELEWAEVCAAFETDERRRRQYAEMRTRFFTELLPWARASGGVTPQSLAHFEASLKFWLELRL